MKKTFDAVAFQRHIRRTLTRRYAEHPELEEKELREIRTKYGFPKPQPRPQPLRVAEERVSYGTGKRKGLKKGFDCVLMMRQIREKLCQR